MIYLISLYFLFLLVSFFFIRSEWIYLFDCYVQRSECDEEGNYSKRELFLPCLTYLWFKDIFTSFSTFCCRFSVSLSLSPSAYSIDEKGKLFGPCTFLRWKFISQIFTVFPFHFIPLHPKSHNPKQFGKRCMRNGKFIICKSSSFILIYFHCKMEISQTRSTSATCSNLIAELKGTAKVKELVETTISDCWIYCAM